MIGAIFDFDGVLFHSERFHERCWEKIAQNDKRPYSREKFLKGFGVKNELFIKDILGWTSDPQEIDEIIAKKMALYREFLQSESPQPIPGTVDLVARLRMSFVPCAIGSSAPKKDLDLVLRHYPALSSSFSVIVSGDDVTVGKPDPEVFLEAARRLHIPASRCVVFEDALAGIEAARRAGMVAVALTTTFPREKLQACHPHVIVDSLSTVNPPMLEQLISQASIS